MDYDEAVRVLLVFEPCSREACTTITIIDDLVDEPDEQFFIVLNRTVDLDTRITISPSEGEITIEDNDSKLAFSQPHTTSFPFSLHTVPIVVGYERTSYTTTETEGFVELCAVIFQPASGEAPRLFELTVNTENGSART